MPCHSDYGDPREERIMSELYARRGIDAQNISTLTRFLCEACSVLKPYQWNEISLDVRLWYEAHERVDAGRREPAARPL